MEIEGIIDIIVLVNICMAVHTASAFIQIWTDSVLAFHLLINNCTRSHTGREINNNQYNGRRLQPD